MKIRNTLGLSLLAAVLAACGGGNDAGQAPAVQLKAGAATAAPANVVVFSGLRSRYSVAYYNGVVTVTDSTGQQAARNVAAGSVLRFDDLSLDLNTSGSSGQAYRLYQAAFNRVPDTAGLSYWAAALDQGMSPAGVAANFVSSDEYRSLYGAAPTIDQTVSAYYRNVLHREGETAGLAYWMSELALGRITVPQMLVNFAESKENKDTTAAATQTGIALFETGVAYQPVARAGEAQEVRTGDPVSLDGSASTANGKLGYSWKLLLKPGGSAVTLSGADTARPGFTPDVAGSYLLSLTVNNGSVASETATVLVIAKTIPELWRAPASAVPASGNYVYVTGSGGDYIIGNRSYLYQPSNAVITMRPNGNYLGLSIGGDQDWTGDFKLPSSKTKLTVGYYDGLPRYPFSTDATGGLSWSGEGRGCNTLSGWIIIDKVAYTGNTLTYVDLRFEQHCEGGSSYMRGQVHWDANDKSGAPGPVLPMPGGLWDVSPYSMPLTGNYIYLDSMAGDYIGGGKTYLYTPSNATLGVSVGGASVRVSVQGNASNGSYGDYWSGDFVGMNILSELQPGYYGSLQRYPFHNPVKGGMDWGGNGRGCNTLTGWFTVDKLSYSAGNLQYLDMRFEQHCEGASAALRGKIHWTQ